MYKQQALAAQFLHGMTTINRVWHTQEDQVSPITFQLLKEQIGKEYETEKKHDKNYEKT